MYGDKITILDKGIFLCLLPVHISHGSENCDQFVLLFTSFLGEHVFCHVTGQQKFILCFERSVHVALGCFQVLFVNVTCRDL